MDPPASTLPVTSQTPKAGAGPPALTRNVTFTPTIKLNLGAAGDTNLGKKRKPADASLRADDDLDAELLDAAEGTDHGKAKRAKMHASMPTHGPANDLSQKGNVPKIRLTANPAPGTPTPSATGRASLPPRPNFASSMLPRATPSLSASLPPEPKVSPKPRVQPLPSVKLVALPSGPWHERLTVSTEIPYRTGRAKQLLKVLSTKGIVPGEVHQYWDDPSEYLK